MQIVMANREQLPEIVNLKQAMFQDAGLWHLLAEDFVDRVLDDYRALYALNDARHFVALEESRLVAMAGGFIKTDLPYRYYRSDYYGFLGDVYTVPAARRQGLATRLSDRVIEWFKSRGVRQVRLLATAEARPIYERRGFVASDEMMLQIEGVE